MTGFGPQRPVGRLETVAGPVTLDRVAAALQRDEAGAAWATIESRPWRACLGESLLTTFRLRRQFWLLAGTYFDLPRGVKISELAVPHGAVRMASDRDGWIALVRASPTTRLSATWTGVRGEPWDHKLLPALGEVASDPSVTPYGPRAE